MRDNMSDESKGGTKKFLYTGPDKSKRDEEDEWDFSSCKKSSSTNSKQDMNFALNQVWSIQKNVTIDTKAQQQTRSGLDNLNLNVGKSYYSRYGNLKDRDTDAGKSKLNQDGVQPQGHQKTYSYSYGNNTKNMSSQSPGSGSVGSHKNGQKEAPRGNSVRTSNLGSLSNDPYGSGSQRGTGASRYF